MPALAQNGIAYTHSFVIGNALVHDARNQLVAWFMKSPATDMLFIDADICWDAMDAVLLAKAPEDVIGGAYRQKRDDREIYNVSGLNPGPPGLIECDYLGTGFLKISRKAITLLAEKYADKTYADGDGNKVYGLFDTETANGRFIGEDALFCRRWNAAGGKCYLVPDMTIIHMGNKAYRGNFAELIARETKTTEAA